MTIKHILLMREDWQATLACIQSFGRRGHRLTVATSGFDDLLTKSDFVSATVPAPVGDEMEDSARALCCLVEAQGYDLVVPITDDDAHTVAMAAELRPDLSSFVVPPLASVECVRDRNLTADMCRTLDLRIPRSIAVTRETLAEAVNTIGFPCFLKVSQSVASQGVIRMDGKEDIPTAFELLASDQTAQLQEPLFGVFHGLTGFCLKGEVIDAVTFDCDYDLATAGTPPYARLAPNPQSWVFLERIAKHLNWSGGIDLDLLDDGQGNTALLEVNPRLSGTVNIALAAGHDLPGRYLEAIGASFDPCPFEAKEFDHFASLAEEAMFRASRQGIELSKRIRGGSTIADNGYPDDRGYSQALNQRLLKLNRRASRRQLLRRIGFNL